MKTINLTITEEDREVYNLLKGFKDDKTRKLMLSRAAEVFNSFCTVDGEEGFFEPEVLKENKLKSMSKEQLLKAREEYLNNVLIYAQDFHPDKNECGVVHSPNDIFWFVDDGAVLGYITIYANYIKAIDEILQSKWYT